MYHVIVLTVHKCNINFLHFTKPHIFYEFQELLTLNVHRPRGYLGTSLSGLVMTNPEFRPVLGRRLS